jgi:hypothetical protein
MAYTTIDDPSVYFQTVLYTGNGGTQAITNGGNSDLQPDWVWTKGRSDADNNSLFDSSRGTTKELNTNGTGAEGTASGVTAFSSDGFTLGSNSGINGNTKTYVAWQWKANGGTETNSQAESGSQIACSVQANTTAGFSIITYTGTGGTGHTFLHGLGSAPAWFIIKRRSGSEDWAVYHHKNTSQPETDHLLLNSTDATSDSNTRFDDTAPNGTEIALGNNAVGNADASTYVCYAFKEIQGYSKFGSYTGNGNVDGPFVYTGFKPAWVILKRSSGVADWNIFDNKRPNAFNEANGRLRSNDSTAESTSDAGVDLLSNGFKCRLGSEFNADDTTNVYMAFAEHPFVSSKGVPTTAR